MLKDKHFTWKSRKTVEGITSSLAKVTDTWHKEDSGQVFEGKVGEASFEIKQVPYHPARQGMYPLIKGEIEDKVNYRLIHFSLINLRLYQNMFRAVLVLPHVFTIFLYFAKFYFEQSIPIPFWTFSAFSVLQIIFLLFGKKYYMERSLKILRKYII